MAPPKLTFLPPGILRIDNFFSFKTLNKSYKFIPDWAVTVSNLAFIFLIRLIFLRDIINSEDSRCVLSPCPQSPAFIKIFLFFFFNKCKIFLISL